MGNVVDDRRPHGRPPAGWPAACDSIVLLGLDRQEGLERAAVDLAALDAHRAVVVERHRLGHVAVPVRVEVVLLHERLRAGVDAEAAGADVQVAVGRVEEQRVDVEVVGDRRATGRRTDGRVGQIVVGDHDRQVAALQRDRVPGLELRLGQGRVAVADAVPDARLDLRQAVALVVRQAAAHARAVAREAAVGDVRRGPRAEVQTTAHVDRRVAIEHAVHEANARVLLDEVLRRVDHAAAAEVTGDVEAEQRVVDVRVLRQLAAAVIHHVDAATGDAGVVADQPALVGVERAALRVDAGAGRVGLAVAHAHVAQLQRVAADRTAGQRRGVEDAGADVLVAAVAGRVAVDDLDAFDPGRAGDAGRDDDADDVTRAARTTRDDFAVEDRLGRQAERRAVGLVAEEAADQRDVGPDLERRVGELIELAGRDRARSVGAFGDVDEGAAAAHRQCGVEVVVGRRPADAVAAGGGAVVDEDLGLRARGQDGGEQDGVLVHGFSLGFPASDVARAAPRADFDRRRYGTESRFAGRSNASVAIVLAPEPRGASTCATRSTSVTARDSGATRSSAPFAWSTKVRSTTSPSTTWPR
ncbi:MAG: hypothetical protein ACE37K_15010 [Planctomycetota bacterium]